MTYAIESQVRLIPGTVVDPRPVIAAPPTDLDELDDEMRVWVHGQEIRRPYDPEVPARLSGGGLATEGGEGLVSEDGADLGEEFWW